MHKSTPRRAAPPHLIASHPRPCAHAPYAPAPSASNVLTTQPTSSKHKQVMMLRTSIPYMHSTLRPSQPILRPYSSRAAASSRPHDSSSTTPSITRLPLFLSSSSSSSSPAHASPPAPFLQRYILSPAARAIIKSWTRHGVAHVLPESYLSGSFLNGVAHAAPTFMHAIAHPPRLSRITTPALHSRLVRLAATLASRNETLRISICRVHATALDSVELIFGPPVADTTMAHKTLVATSADDAFRLYALGPDAYLVKIFHVGFVLPGDASVRRLASDTPGLVDRAVRWSQLFADAIDEGLMIRVNARVDVDLDFIHRHYDYSKSGPSHAGGPIRPDEDSIAAGTIISSLQQARKSIVMQFESPHVDGDIFASNVAEDDENDDLSSNVLMEDAFEHGFGWRVSDIDGWVDSMEHNEFLNGPLIKGKLLP
ncbi:hypothetical protein SeMB42_g02047 [Synchytrium endobioticum]|uniref:Uncharacterized protein n=1 Tax=Synchytrium endobioticum TaxID=286115 RepID=A0A507D1C2_9FUNG|nr:hypothetical protein SeLEV6574_g03973 [Synchytrium endobioticum]TPX51025.1 hypothetical protein SeMB42_g02047 [Synchytrium endobioticum]